MIAVTATVRPNDSVRVLHLLEQGLRRHFAGFRVFDDSLIIDVPGVGRVLVTEELTVMRLDFVVEDAAAAAATTALEAQIRARVHNHSISFAWSRPATVPRALR